MSLIINIPLAANSESFIAVRLEIIVRLPNINTSKLQMTQHKQGEEKQVNSDRHWPQEMNGLERQTLFFSYRGFVTADGVCDCVTVCPSSRKEAAISAFVSALVVVVALVGCKGFLFILSFLLTGKKWAGLFDFNKTWVTSAALEKLHFYATNSLTACALIRKPFFFDSHSLKYIVHCKGDLVFCPSMHLTCGCSAGQI